MSWMYTWHLQPCQAIIFSSSNTSETSVWLLTCLFCFLLSKKKCPLKGRSSLIITCGLTTARAFSSLLLISQQLKVYCCETYTIIGWRKHVWQLSQRHQWNKQNSCKTQNTSTLLIWQTPNSSIYFCRERKKSVEITCLFADSFAASESV